MTDTPIRITGVSFCTTPENWETGDKLLAHIDVEAGGFSFGGCLLIQRKRGDHYFQLPRIEGRSSDRRAVKIIDQDLRTAVTHAAVEALRKFQEATR